MTDLRQSSLNEIQKTPKYFWILFVVFSITASIVFFDHFRGYYSRVTILVVHKNEKMAASADQVVDNVAEFPKTLAFYDRLLKQYPEIHDPWIGMDSETRRLAWIEHVDVRRVDYTGLIHLRIDADSSSDASSLAEKSANTLLRMIGQYYDIRSEIDVRIVEGPITYPFMRNPFLLALLSLSIGFALALVMSLAIQRISLSTVDTTIRKRKDDAYVISKPVTFPKAVTDDFFKKVEYGSQAIANSQNVEKTESIQKGVDERKSPLIAKESIVVTQEKAVKAPSYEKRETNLPFLEEGVSLEQYLFGNKQESQEEKSETDHETQEAIKEDIANEQPQEEEKNLTEPTQEEYKRRLNQLLRGE